MALRDFTVFIVDDDQGVLDALSALVQEAGYETKAYTSPQAFLDEHDPSMPGCVVLDLSMPRMNGLEFQRELVTRGIERPIIFLSGRGTIPASVAAMKAGAVDFLPKPCKGDELLNAIKIAGQRDGVRLQRAAERKAANKLVDKLTPREKEVMELVVRGHLNKDYRCPDRHDRKDRQAAPRTRDAENGRKERCGIGAAGEQSNYRATIIRSAVLLNKVGPRSN